MYYRRQWLTFKSVNSGIFPTLPTTYTGKVMDYKRRHISFLGDQKNHRKLTFHLILEHIYYTAQYGIL